MIAQVGELTLGKTSLRKRYRALRNRIVAKASVAGYSKERILLSSPIFLFVILLASAYFSVMSNFTSRKFLIFNLDALGHYLEEFIGLLRSLPLEEKNQPYWLFFLGAREGSRVNRYLLSKIKTLPAATEISLKGIPPILWIPLAALSEVRPPRLENVFYPTFPTFTQYTPLKKGEFLAVMRPGEAENFEHYMDFRLPSWRRGYCVLCIRDGAYYGDSDSQRNSAPSLYLAAVQLLLDRGIPVVRMGRKVSEAFPIVHINFLDLGFEGDLNDYLDVMLWANASMAVGDSTGLLDAVALLGGNTFCANYPMDPRAFISAANYWFAFQELREVRTGRILKIGEVVELMNQGWNLGDEALLAERGFENAPMTSAEIALATEWFLSELEKGAIPPISAQQQELMTFLARQDKGAWLHYRKDALFGVRWLSMKSKIYPGSIAKIL